MEGANQPMGELMAASRFNPHQILIKRFEQHLTHPATVSSTARFSYEVELALPEKRNTPVEITRLVISAAGNSMETKTQHDLVVQILETMIEAIRREREGIRPGTP